MSGISKDSLSEYLRKRDEAAYPFVRDKTYRAGYFTYLTNKISDNSFQFYKLRKHFAKNFLVFRTQKLGDELILRALSDEIKRRFKIKVGDRDRIVSQTNMLLKDSVNKNVIRLDIKSFYESIDRQTLLKKISSANRVSFFVEKYLDKFFALLDKMEVKGLPRGLAISSTLSEVYLQEVDQKVRSFEGVYFYQRYVDDIIIFTIEDVNKTTEFIKSILPIGLNLNEVKTKPYTTVSCKCKIKCIHQNAVCPCLAKCVCKKSTKQNNLEFLGYKLTFDDILDANLSRAQRVNVSLSNRKSNRLKTRVIKSFQSFIKIPNFELLELRLKFLTSNHRVRRLGAKGKLNSGIYYNSSLLSSPKSLENIDLFYRGILTNKKYPKLAAQLDQALNATQKQRLINLSFQSGYNSRRRGKFTIGDVGLIRRCWNRV